MYYVAKRDRTACFPVAKMYYLFFCALLPCLSLPRIILRMTKDILVSADSTVLTSSALFHPQALQTISSGPRLFPKMMSVSALQTGHLLG
jgi:hypothetical protein